VPNFLILDTSSRLCSVSIANGDNIIWSESEISETGFCHSEYLHLLIKRCIKKTFGKSKSAVKEISAVALAGGPGSYTGLRIGASAAKGLALPLGIPLISYSTLEALAYASKNSISSNLKIDAFWSAMDARRNEIYCSLFSNDFNRITEDSPFVLDETPIPDLWSNYKNVYASGDGVEKAKDYWPTLIDSGIRFSEAKHGISLVLNAWEKKEFVNLESWTPNYLKKFRPGSPKFGLPAS
jgi:tRNA threonylcarbamoyladenosine biosynthesis protein TsaB